ncbi:MAG: HAD family phosphatase [Marmoricola sp.]|nr:HAD family phosphatase [Marmoricola sp.]
MGRPSARPSAVLWDMDGTLVDTEPYWIEREYVLAEKYGGTWTHDDAMAVVGADLMDSAAYMQRRMGIDRTPLEIIEELLDGVVEMVRHEVPWQPGARELLAALREQGTPSVLVTMSWRRFVDPVVDQLPRGSFEAVLCGDEVTRGKPHPEPYLAAASLVGCRPEDTLAIEDSPTGAASAGAAGCRVLVVPNHVDVPRAPYQVQRPTLAGVDPAGLAELYDEAGTSTTVQ